MDTPDISVYGEAKGEYTRQLCVFLVPTLETYILGLLEEAKKEAPNPKKVLWQFQTILQGIPDWNQDKVLRETDKIQKDCKCDYLEELLTAVFIAHTKVLSAIRLTTRQKKLQITIPKLDHFIHRLLSEAARNLWTNAYLFADTTSIEKQKNLRQVSSLLSDAVLQAIRGLLPVKSILREYLHDEDVDEETPAAHADEATQEDAVEGDATQEGAGVEDDAKLEEAKVEGDAKLEVEGDAKLEAEAEAKEAKEEVKLEAKEAEAEAEPEAEVKVVKVEAAAVPALPATAAQAPPSEAPVIQIDAKPSVTFSSDHVFFDSSSLDANEIQEIPFLDEDEEITVDSEVLGIEADSL
jgi:hypothetical protein